MKFALHDEVSFLPPPLWRLMPHLSLRVAGSIARDVAKHLKVEEYNMLFGLADGVDGKASSNAKAKVKVKAKVKFSLFP